MGYFFAYPWDTFAAAWHAVSSAYLALFEGSVLDFGSFTGESNVPILGPISDTLFNAAPLILGGLSVAVAFRAGLFNIGGQGQLIAGAICAGWVGFTWHLPVLLHLLVAMVAGLVGGAIWGGIAGWLKAQTGAHEVISTIMLNYIALYLLFYLLSVPGFQAEGSNQAISMPDRLRPPASRGCSGRGCRSTGAWSSRCSRRWPAGGCSRARRSVSGCAPSAPTISPRARPG